MAIAKRRPSQAARRMVDDPVVRVELMLLPWEGPKERTEPKRVENPERPFSKVKNAVQRVWEICGSMPKASRQEQIDACVAAGINVHTARTQQSKWARRPAR